MGYDVAGPGSTDRSGAKPGKVVIVLHRLPGSAGAIGQWLVGQGYELDIRRPKFGDVLPANLEDYQGAIIFGGPNSANDEDDFIRAETDWIGSVLKANMPYLGVCLGGQMLASFLGCGITRHPEGFVERGYYPITGTADGASLCGAWPSHVYQWHQEGFDIPKSATALAVSDGIFPNQAFISGASAIGLQFHPEITYTLINRWTKRPEPLLAPGACDRPTHFSQHLLYSPEVRAWLDRFLRGWLGGSGRF